MVTRGDKYTRIEKHELYQCWRWMNRKYKSRKEVCERWFNFWNFVEDIKTHPNSKEYNFSRIDPNKPFQPDNWKWIPRKTNTTEGKRERGKLRMRDWIAKKRIEDPDYEQESSLRKQFKIGVKEYRDMFNKQNGVCAICGEKEKALAVGAKRPRRLAVDHCHSTDKIRGLLCNYCNRGLGCFKDNIKNLETAINYLKTNKEN